jgi:carbon-monoxide dehydrogenase medium subunit
MIPSSFDYHRPASVDEALGLLQEHGDDAKLLAGGHSLLPAMKLRLSAPGHLIDIGALGDLNYIKEDGDHLAIGATTTHYQIESSDLVQAKASVLAQAAAVIGDPQVRNVGTIGGSIAHADPAADYPAALLAADATIQLKGPDGERSIDAVDFFIDLYLTSLQADEIITEVRLPAQASGRGGVYLKFPHPASRFAVVGVAAVVSVDGGSCSNVRVAFNGVANAAFRDSAVENALNGQTADAISAAGDLAADSAEILSDNFAGEDYRKHLAKVYAKRALVQAVQAAQ